MPLIKLISAAPTTLSKPFIKELLSLIEGHASGAIEPGAIEDFNGYSKTTQLDTMMTYWEDLGEADSPLNKTVQKQFPKDFAAYKKLWPKQQPVLFKQLLPHFTKVSW